MHRSLGILSIIGLLIWISSVYATSGHQSEGDDCLQCHSNLLNGSVKHFIEENGDCRFCHEPVISGSGIQMITDRDDGICSPCHSNHEQRPSIGAHSQIDCINCHSPHSSNNKTLFVRTEQDLCSTSCHGDHDIGLSHPVGGGVRDQHTGGTMTCVSSCHEMHEPSEQKFLQLAELDLCYQCHGEKF